MLCGNFFIRSQSQYIMYFAIFNGRNRQKTVKRISAHSKNVKFYSI